MITQDNGNETTLLSLRRGWAECETPNDFMRLAEVAGQYSGSASLALTGVKHILNGADGKLVANPVDEFSQFVWSCGISATLDKKTLNKMQDTVRNSEAFRTEWITVAMQAGRYARNLDVGLVCGNPGSWFHYNTKEDYVNIELRQMLRLGFWQTRTVVMHEIGHSMETPKWPDFIGKEIEKLKGMRDAVEGAKELKDGDPVYDAVVRQNNKVGYMTGFMNAFEDNCVNEFTGAIPEIERSENPYFLRDALNDMEQSILPDLSKRSWETNPRGDVGRFNYMVNACFFARNGIGAFAGKNRLDPKIWKEEYGTEVPSPGMWAATKVAMDCVTGKHLRTSAKMLDPVGYAKKSDELFAIRGAAAEKLWNEELAALVEKALDEKLPPPRMQIAGDGKLPPPEDRPGNIGNPQEGSNMMRPGEGAKGDAKDGKTEDGDAEGEIGKPGGDGGMGEKKSIRDIINDHKDASQVANDEKKKQAETAKDAKAAADEAFKGMGAGGSWGLDTIPLGDFSTYEAARKSLGGVIGKMRSSIVATCQELIAIKQSEETELSAVPRGAGINRPAAKRFVRDQLLGVNTEESRYFHIERPEIPTLRPPTVVFLVDASGSMSSSDKTGATYYQRALQTAFIMREGAMDARRPLELPTSPVDVYICLWGASDRGSAILTPDVTNDEAAKRLAYELEHPEGHGTGTELAAGFSTSINAIVNAGINKKNKEEFVAGTHFIVVGDGDAFDHNESVNILSAVGFNRNATIDVFDISGQGAAPLKSIALEARKNGGDVVYHQISKDQIGGKLASIFKNRALSKAMVSEGVTRGESTQRMAGCAQRGNQEGKIAGRKSVMGTRGRKSGKGGI